MGEAEAKDKATAAKKEEERIAAEAKDAKLAAQAKIAAAKESAKAQLHQTEQDKVKALEHKADEAQAANDKQATAALATVEARMAEVETHKRNFEDAMAKARQVPDSDQNEEAAPAQTA